MEDPEKGALSTDPITSLGNPESVSGPQRRGRQPVNQICWSECFRSCQSVCGIRIAKGEPTSRLHPHTGWKQICGHRGLGEPIHEATTFHAKDALDGLSCSNQHQLEHAVPDGVHGHGDLLQMGEKTCLLNMCLFVR